MKTQIHSSSAEQVLVILRAFRGLGYVMEPKIAATAMTKHFATVSSAGKIACGVRFPRR